MVFVVVLLYYDFHKIDFRPFSGFHRHNIVEDATEDADRRSQAI